MVTKHILLLPDQIVQLHLARPWTSAQSPEPIAVMPFPGDAPSPPGDARRSRPFAVLACSALKEAYRQRLKRAGDVRIVYLKGDQATIAARIAARRHKYMPPALLPSQFATLEEPADAFVVDIREPVETQVARIRKEFSL